MSKGGDVLNQVNPDLLPSSWYSISTKLKDLVKRCEVRMSGYGVHAVYELLYRGEECLWAKSVMSPFSEMGTCYLLAWVCALRTREFYWELVWSLRASVGIAPYCPI